MFKQKNKEPFGKKLRVLGVLSVGSGIRLFGLRSKCSVPCVLTSCTSPLTSYLQCHASSLLRKYHSERDTYVYMPVHIYHLTNALGSTRCFPPGLSLWLYYNPIAFFQQGQASLGHRLSLVPVNSKRPTLPTQTANNLSLAIWSLLV